MHHRKLKEKAKKDREEKERTQAAHPGTYQQPDAFNTNPYWSEEIMMGPHIERKKKKNGGSKNASQRNLTSAGKDTASLGGSSIGVSITNPIITSPSAVDDAKPMVTSAGKDRTSVGGSSSSSVSISNGDIALHSTPDKGKPNWTHINKKASTVGGSSIGVSIISPDTTSPTPEREKLSLSTTLSDDWNHKRYQREDEELWGEDWSRTGHKLMDAIKSAGATAGRFIEVSLGKEAKLDDDEESDSFYFAQRNPPVNDYHPPIVRQHPSHRRAIQWMVQPPPPAKVMEGKIPVSRSGSFVSHLSQTTVASEGLDPFRSRARLNIRSG
jgi:hypothetical protein